MEPGGVGESDQIGLLGVVLEPREVDVTQVLIEGLGEEFVPKNNGTSLVELAHGQLEAFPLAVGGLLLGATQGPRKRLFPKGLQGGPFL